MNEYKVSVITKNDTELFVVNLIGEYPYKDRLFTLVCDAIASVVEPIPVGHVNIKQVVFIIPESCKHGTYRAEINAALDYITNNYASYISLSYREA